jgi:saccharopine dehydrogenase-like NADP-dependent oxidoreductase
MAQRVLILGGSGRVGRSVAADLITHTDALITLAGRSTSLTQQISDRLGTRTQPLAFDLADRESLAAAIANANLVIHCAGPFHHQDGSILETCINSGVNYIDVSDHPSYTEKVMQYRAAATEAGVTAIVNSGIFPGISNSMVRRDVEQLDKAERIHLSYVVAGSGGAGVTVMRTTFLGLQSPFQGWIDGRWQTIKPYSDREIIQFPHYGPVDVYWFNVPEAFTLPAAFPVETVITKFGTVPRFYNFLTWTVARGWHPWLLQQKAVIEFLSQVSHFMTDVTDRLSGIGVAIRSEVTGKKDGKRMRSLSTLVHPNTAIAAGYGTGSVAQLIINGQLHKPGVWTVEEALPTSLFEETLNQRQVKIHQQILQD